MLETFFIKNDKIYTNMHCWKGLLMITNRAYKVLKKFQKLYKKRINNDYDNDLKKKEAIFDAKNRWLNAKKNPSSLNCKNEEEQKNIIHNRKLAYLSTKVHKEVPLNEYELRKIILDVYHLPKYTLNTFDLNGILEELELQDAIVLVSTLRVINNETVKVYDMTNKGEQLYEEYKTERASKIRIPIIAMVISIISLFVAIGSLIVSIVLKQ